MKVVLFTKKNHVFSFSNWSLIIFYGFFFFAFTGAMECFQMTVYECDVVVKVEQR